MAKTIWKYPAFTAQSWTQLMPAGAKVLSVQPQGNDVQMWAIVDAGKPDEARKFTVYGTGHPMPSDPGVFIGTFQLDGGALIFHLFECA